MTFIFGCPECKQYDLSRTLASDEEYFYLWTCNTCKHTWRVEI